MHSRYTRLSQSFKSLFSPANCKYFSTGAETVLSFKNVSFEYRPNMPLLDNVSFNVREGSKITIMGQNGSGKSTIMKLMNGLLQPTQGSINVKQGYALSRALQVIPFEDRNKTVRDFFLTRLHGVTSGLDSRMHKVLKTVELENIPNINNRIISSFSGGQQARLLLASSLILEPDILLLDEPTNNLDMKGIDLLSSIISSINKTCVVISHDEDFLNSFTDSVLYLDNHLHKIEYYDGDYNIVKREIMKRIDKENMENQRLQKEIEKKKQQAANFSQKGGTNIRKQAKKLKETAEELATTKITVRKEDLTLLPFKIPYQRDQLASASSSSSFGKGKNAVKSNAADVSSSKAITINSIDLPKVNLSVDYSSTPILFNKGKHIRIKGPNGIGKTTLLNSLVHRENNGIEINSDLTIGYYRQDFHNLNHDNIVMECLYNASSGKHDEGTIRKTAAKFFISKDLVNRQVFTLSEGQKGLLSLCCLVLQEPGLLILDEPTNHINFRHLPVLANAFNDFEGTLLIVSHDQEFMDRVKIDYEFDLAMFTKKQGQFQHQQQPHNKNHKQWEDLHDYDASVMENPSGVTLGATVRV